MKNTLVVLERFGLVKCDKCNSTMWNGDLKKHQISCLWITAIEHTEDTPDDI